jgi:hypothetical protein
MRQSSGLDKFKSFLPFLAAFAILNQIGNCYENSEKKASMPKINRNTPTPTPILKALYYFGDIEDEQTLNEIRIFRNLIVHDASLFFFEESKNEYYRFRYSDNNETSNLINFAEEKWDGNFDSISPKNVTTVNRKVLINKTSDIIGKLSKINESNELKISLPGKEKELINRYFLLIPRN